jgi:hypothetical protein
VTKARDDFPAHELPGLFSYKEDTGELIYKPRPDQRPQWNRKFAGKIAGTINDRGYVIICIYGKDFRAHRIIWAIKTGEWPDFEVDHENLVKSDNRWGNLRHATHSQNNCNKGAQSNNKSGYKGVSWCKVMKAWVASIRFAGVTTKIGYRGDPAEAHELYRAEALRLHGDFSNTGGT